MLCAEDLAKQGTTWNGDSGGPLFITPDDSADIVQVGIVSWGGLDPTEITYNMYVDLCHYRDWIKDAMARAGDDSWLELHTGGGHGMVMVHDKMGEVATVCNDKVGKNEINAICRELGYKTGAIADVREFLPEGRKQKKEAVAYIPPYGYTNLNCGDDVKDVMKECTVEEYKDAEVPCFHGQQLAVKCADEDWSFKVNYMIPEIKSVREVASLLEEESRVWYTLKNMVYHWT